MQRFIQGSIVFEKPGTFSEKLKTLTSSNQHGVRYFLLKFCTRFLLTSVYKRVFGIVLFRLDLELFVKTKKHLVSRYSRKPGSSITQDLNKIEKIPNTLLQTLVSRKGGQNFSKKILNSMVVGAHQSFQFSRQITWFLGNNKAFLNLNLSNYKTIRP